MNVLASRRCLAVEPIHWFGRFSGKRLFSEFVFKIILFKINLDTP